LSLLAVARLQITTVGVPLTWEDERVLGVRHYLTVRTSGILRNYSVAFHLQVLVESDLDFLA